MDPSQLPAGTVTFLFTDIEGSTRLLRELRDRYHDAVAEHRRLLRAAVDAEGGREVDTQGDSFFFAFRRARDAARAAVAAQRALAAHDWPAGASLRVRMGMHTGEPTVGGEGYIGLGVNRAARIMALGRGGQVLLSQATASVLGDEDLEGAGIRDLGERPLKDFDRPERVYELAIEGLVLIEPEPAPAPAASPQPASALMAAPARGELVGRERELEALAGALEDCLAGRGRVVLLAGEPGIGKTRLAEELGSRAAARGARVLVGRCWEAGGAPAYWPWVQSLRAYVRDAEPEALRAQLGAGAGELAQLLPDLRDRYPDLPDPPGVESDAARFRLFDSVAGFLRRAAGESPLVLLLDDLHAADEPSLLLLRFLARELGASRLLLLGAYRDLDPTMSAALAGAVAELAREPVTTALAIGGLAEDDVARYFELAVGEAPADLAARVHAETEGNPLFVGEIVRLLAAEGRLDESGAERLAIPQSVKEVIGRRMRHLSPDCARVLALASVLGREFDLEALARVAELDRLALLELLDEAVRIRVLSEVPGAPGRLRFAHALIRDTAYQELSAASRAQLHHHVAETLEALYATDPDPHLTELAHHYLEAAPAGHERKAVEYAARAAERTGALLAYEEAARLYRAALALSPARDTARCELLLALGDAQTRAGDTPGAKLIYRDAAELADSLGLPEHLGRAALGYGGRIIWEVSRDDPYLLPLLERAIAAQARQDTPLRVRLLARLGGGPLRDASFPPQRRWNLTREALESARRLGDPHTLTYALECYIAAHHSPDHTRPQVGLSTESIEIAREVGDLERELEAREHRCAALLELGDLGGFKADVAEMGRLARELRQPSQLWIVTQYEAQNALMEGRLAEAERLIDEALELGEQAQSWNAVVSQRLQLFHLRHLQGRLAEVEPALRAAVARHPTYPVLRCAHALLVAELGRTAVACSELRALAADDCAAVPFDEEWLLSACLLAETAALVGDTPLAAALYERLRLYDDRVAVGVPELAIGAVSRHLGQLATALDRWSVAEDHFAEAAALNARIGARPALWHSRREHGEMLLLRGEPGDAERARGLLDQAVGAYRALGMESYAARASERLAAAVA